MNAYDFLYKLATEQPFLFWCALWLVWPLIGLIRSPFWIMNRYFRSKNIRERGWPTVKNMDADGDIVKEEGK